MREFGLDASHELRGPLAALAANAEMGLLDCPDAESPQRRRFAAIASATDQMQRLVDDLLQLVRQEEGTVEQPSRLALAELVREQLALYGDAFALRRQQLESDLEDDLMVIGQANLSRQLIRNLLDNAHRYCPEQATVRVRLRRRGRLAFLEVSDDGPGIDQQALPRVFDRFWRASAHRGDGGSGMGLAIAASISRAHGGDIRVDSAPGQGSRFVVDLPLAFG